MPDLYMRVYDLYGIRLMCSVVHSLYLLVLKYRGGNDPSESCSKYFLLRLFPSIFTLKLLIFANFFP